MPGSNTATMPPGRTTRASSCTTVAGVVTALQRKYTKRGDLMGTFVLEDLGSAIEVMVFPKTMAQYGELLDADAIVVVKARVDGRDDTPKLMAMEISRPEINLDGSQPLTLRLKAGVLTDERVARLRELLGAHPGESPVFVRLVGTEKETVLRLGDEFRCEARNGLYAELRVLFGAVGAGKCELEGKGITIDGAGRCVARGRKQCGIARRAAALFLPALRSFARHRNGFAG